jgi:hypothetical protein
MKIWSVQATKPVRFRSLVATIEVGTKEYGQLVVTGKQKSAPNRSYEGARGPPIERSKGPGGPPFDMCGEPTGPQLK